MAYPLIAPMMGFWHSPITSTMSRPSPLGSIRLSVARQARSRPEQKDLPLPVIIATLMIPSPATRSMASYNPFNRAWLMALRRSGRFRGITATSSSHSNSIGCSMFSPISFLSRTSGPTTSPALKHTKTAYCPLTISNSSKTPPNAATSKN